MNANYRDFETELQALAEESHQMEIKVSSEVAVQVL